MERGYRPEQHDHEHEATSANALKGLIEQGAQNLLTELGQGKSDRLQEYLAFSARFHRYSLSNQFLIHMQCPHATRVAGYRHWQKLGYQVARGQKGIRILAPHSYTYRDDETDSEQKGIYFVSVAVFDASQLANLADRPLPEFWTPLPDDQHALYARLEHVVRDDGIDVSESAYLGTMQGFSAHGEIVLKEGMDSRSKLFVLLHEYAHELLHWDEGQTKYSDPVRECHAEAVSYIVAAHFDLHNPRSSDYLLQWGNTAEELLNELGVVTRTAGYIIDKLHPQKGGD